MRRFLPFVSAAISLGFLANGVCSPPAASADKAEPASIPYTTTWLGNSHGRGDGKWVQNNILGLYVTSTGVVYTNSWWDEGRRESGIYAGSDGDPAGALESLHDSFGGGFAVTGDDQYIYAANWDTVRRCHLNGTRAPFPGGLGKNEDSIDVSTAPTGKDKSRGVRGLAVDVSEHRLFVSESTDGEIEVWDTQKMIFVRRWALERPGPLAITPDHTIWVISRKEADAPAKVLHFSPEGQLLPEVITGPEGFDPTAIWFDPVSTRLLVADNGPEQNIKIYGRLDTSRSQPDATFGTSVYAGRAGEITAAKFGSSGLTGVATDARGNLYVSLNGVGPASFWHGGGTVLESWAADGTLRWRKLGLAFVDCADADPASDIEPALDVYDKYSRYRLSLNRTGAGTEWAYAGRTLDPFKYPTDQRFLRAADGWDYTGGTLVRNIDGHRLLYVLSMQARRLLIYRFDAATGETAIPAGLWESQAGYKSGYAGAPGSGDFFWRDRDGNGSFDEGEFLGGPGMPNLGVGLWVDSRGDIWSCNHWSSSGIGIRRWKMQGFDPRGNPIYDFSPGNYTEYQRPDGSHGELRRLEYFPETDTMYVSSTSKVDGDRDAGHRIVKYLRWSTPDRAIAWTLDPPMDKTKISALSIAGDYLFLGYSYFGSNSREGTIHVYRNDDATYVGEITPTPAVGSISGTFDIPYAIRAFQRKNGEYLIFAEDDHYAKVIVHRWNPVHPALVDTLDGLQKTDSGRSSPDWDIDRSNAPHFSGDRGRARRTKDVPSHLVWESPSAVDFSAAVYFDAKIDIDSFVTFQASGDGENWTSVPASRTPTLGSGGGWAVTNYRPEAGRLPADTRFLRMSISPTGMSWNLQLGRMEINCHQK